MSTTASRVTHAGSRPLPMVVYFEHDPACHGVLNGVQRFRRIAFEDLGQVPPEVERVVFVSNHRLVEENYDGLRGPRTRVLALCDQRFSSPRTDGLVYAYLPTKTPNALLERMVDNAIDHIHLIASREEVNQRLAGATREISELNRIGAALSAEHDTGKLLEMILTKSREITRSDAGSLYLVEEYSEEDEGAVAPARAAGTVEAGAKAVHTGDETAVRRRLRFKLAQNDSVQVPFREVAMEISEQSIAGYVALTGGVVALEDAYHLPADVPYSINRKFDEDSGYRTRSICAVPMRNAQGETVGVLQLINAKRNAAAKLESLGDVSAQVVPFSMRQLELLESLASQAAVALENSRLYEAIQRLFEGFVKASVSAIEARDPTTSGHSFRVANLTVALAEAVNRCDAGAYRDVRFSRTEMREIRYASLLHDFGKVGVREEVLVKAKKLYPAQLDLIHQRFQLVKRTLQSEADSRRVRCLLEKGREEYLAKAGEFDAELQQRIAELDAQFEVVLKSNEPSVLPEGEFDRLAELARRQYIDLDGRPRTLLTGDEVRLLSIRKGSLDEAERQQIESHVVHTFNFLQQIPWTKEIRSIPEIARGHHEKLNGLGYPYKLSAPEIPVQTRMMTISDIFDALSASDRPYKKAVDLDRALQILDFAVKDGELDGTLYGIFKEAKVFERWKVEPVAY